MIKKVGFEKTLARIHKIDVGLIDMTIPHKLMLKRTQKRFKKTFERGGDPKWKKITETTLKLREVNKNAKPLIDRGNLMRALSSPRSRYAKHKVFKKSFRIAISSTLRNNGAFYPAIMEKGATVNNAWGRGGIIKIPARPFMHFTNEDRREDAKIMHLYLEGLVRA